MRLNEKPVAFRRGSSYCQPCRLMIFFVHLRSRRRDGCRAGVTEGKS